MAVYFVTGNLGGGKSLMAVNRIKECLDRGAPVATNLDINLHHMFNKDRKNVTLYRMPDKPSLEDFTIIGVGNKSYDEKKNGLIVLDECGTWFNSRQWADKERQKIINWLLHARKLGWDVIFIVQNISIVDKQARLALGEHVVYCRRTDRMNIPVLGSIFKIFAGGKLPLPRVHIGIVKYGLLPTSITVDTWVNAGSSLFLTYDTKQVFSDYYEDGVYSVLPPHWTHGRYAVSKTMRFYMRLTKIYARKYSRLFIFSLGAILTFFISEAVAYKYSSSNLNQDFERSIHWDAEGQVFDVLEKEDNQALPDPVIERQNFVEYEWKKVSSMTVNNKVQILHNGVHDLGSFPYEVKFENQWFYAKLPIKKEFDF